MTIVYRMRALVRVLPLLAAAAQCAACSTNHAAKGTPGGAQPVAAAGVAETGPRPVDGTPARSMRAFPDRALLQRQPAPPCELANPPADIRPEEARVATIDYERQCYRQLAGIVHARLATLQEAVARTHALGPRDRALMQPESSPHCDAAKPPANPPEARAAALDTERQCYRQIATRESDKLEALQDAVRKANRGQPPIRRRHTAGAARAPHVSY